MSDTIRKTAAGLPLEGLKHAAGGYARALGGSLVDKVTDRVSGLSDRLTSYATGGGGSDDDDGGGTSAAGAALSKTGETLSEGGSPLKAGLKGAFTGVKGKVKGIFGGGKGGGSKAFKFNNIVESFDIGVPADLVYDAWTQYDQWPSFMKKLENAELDDEEGEVTLKGQVFWSHREWKTTITEQVPGRRIHWKSSGPKGHISGVVTFHDLGGDLTRVVVVLAYHPQGFMEKTANMWRAANRRVRLELKHFVRHVMTESVLNPDEVEGYRAEIHDEEVVRTHDEVVSDEQADEEAEDEEYEGDEYEGDEYEGEDYEGEDYGDEELQDEQGDEGEDEGEYADEGEEYEGDEYDEDAESDEEPEEQR